MLAVESVTQACRKLTLFRTEFEVTVPSGIPLEIHQNRISSLVVDMARERLLPRLLHAVINNDRKTVREMLDLNPEILPPSGRGPG